MDVWPCQSVYVFLKTLSSSMALKESDPVVISILLVTFPYVNDFNLHAYNLFFNIKILN